ncbi:hypothetical protein K505DRAFT_421699 [Melanomma pulvis-pyrius CBS 109.77]|uniref:Rhodopsin domain-containing protein n=1 Tax=Melanomma pulvis-pyrius CBS 109.77 TaxID=1314802 RepID=A0A6A6WTX8_9PLEO|nr:hypothetical protein K505DRAFT_421699 [Melanomma pulvis-pyrius CBS 109.77]
MGHPYSVPAVYDEPARGILSTLIALTTVCAIARVASRWIQKADSAADDYLSYLAYFLNLANLISGILLIPKHAVSLPGLMLGNPDDLDYITNSFIAIGIFYILTILLSKLSVLFLFRRIFTMHITTFRIAWWANLLFLVPCWTAPVFTLMGLSIARKDLRQSDISKIGTPVVAALNAFSDIMMLLLPVWSISKLRLPKQQKIALVGVFAVAMIATGVSIGRAALLFIRNHVQWNPAYNTYMDIVMTASETSAAFMCSCLPVLKPIIIKVNKLCSRSVSRITGTLQTGRRDPTGSKASRLSLHSDRDTDTWKVNSSQKGIHRVREYDVDVDVIPLQSGMRGHSPS